MKQLLSSMFAALLLMSDALADDPSLKIGTRSEVEIEICSLQNQCVGVSPRTGDVRLEIEGSRYLLLSARDAYLRWLILDKNPPAGEYTVVVTGRASQKFRLDLFYGDDDQKFDQVLRLGEIRGITDKKGSASLKVVITNNHGIGSFEVKAPVGLRVDYPAAFRRWGGNVLVKKAHNNGRERTTSRREN